MPYISLILSRSVSINNFEIVTGKMKTGSNVYNQEFTSISISDQHTFSSDGEEKQFKCKSCEACYKQKQSLNFHVASFHEGKKLFKCEICEISFFQKAGLKGHISSVHEKKKPYT
jgi:uncharacterized C2H2 Zn-finger protein